MLQNGKLLKFARQNVNAVEILTLENNHLKVSVAPAIGGKIISIYNKSLEHEFLWTNKNLQITTHEPGTSYDDNFIGGIDELIPNDIPETIDGIAYPDHGELWTSKLKYEIEANSITVYGLLRLSGLNYSKTISLDDSGPLINLSYRIENNSGTQRNFMWKLHAALNINEGDKIITDAKKAIVADPEYSRFKKELSEFNWPQIENTNASVIPDKNGSMDFLYLYNTTTGKIQLQDKEGRLFGYSYDTKVFPYQWLFASYGGFLDHYTAILEPCTNMPISVNDAKSLSQSASLNAGEILETSVTIFAGEKKHYINE